MKQIIGGGIIGAVIIFIWSFLAWGILPVHSSGIKAAQNEDALIAVMNGCLSEHAVYFFPGMPSREQVKTDGNAEQKFEAKYQSGPVGMIIYNPVGHAPMNPKQFIVGFILAFVMTAFAIWLLKRSTAYNSGYIGRVVFFGLLGLFIAVSVHLTNWNWMEYPFAFTTGMIIDSIAGWILIGAGVSLVVKPKKEVVS